MKLSYFLLFFLLFYNASMLVVDQKPNIYPGLSPYHCYFIIKELCKVCVHGFFTQTEKMSQAIVCVQCHRKIIASVIWGYAAGAMNQIILDEFRLLLYDGSKEEFVEYLRVSAYELGMKCPGCQGKEWYISHEGLSIN